MLTHDSDSVQMDDGAAGIKEPRLRASGIHMQELEEFFLEMPEAEQPVFGDAQGTEVYQRAEEGEVGIGI